MWFLALMVADFRVGAGGLAGLAGSRGSGYGVVHVRNHRRREKHVPRWFLAVDVVSRACPPSPRTAAGVFCGRCGGGG
ncbi:hypothetical protein GCM10010462_19770 [Microbacterium dextranolyticum]|uniref:Uncharacterized protein n=1 Tax=Microbacterium dextranolyticum TaxID=36806 RepID=A0A9W6HJK3_9MICO|nr:hypothetical protein GCM10017591_04320 [Microbacterium dextranolyticum]